MNENSVAAPRCPYCSTTLVNHAAIACKDCGRKWDKTSHEWARADSFWGRFAWLWAILAIIAAAAISRRDGYFFGNLLLSPFSWLTIFSLIMAFRASGRRAKALYREQYSEWVATNHVKIQS